MDTVFVLLAISAPIVLAAIMIQILRSAEQAIAKLNERVHALSRRCDIQRDDLDRYHAALMELADRRVQTGMLDEYTMAEVKAALPVLRVRRASATNVVLPPAAWEGERFLLGEPVDHGGRNGSARYRVHARGPDRRYWVGSRPVTTREFRCELPTFPE